MTSRCTLYLCTEVRVPGRTVYGEWSLSFSFPCHVRESRYPHRLLGSPPCRAARYAMNKPMLYYGEFIHEICVTAGPPTLTHPPEEGAFSTRDNTPRKIVPRLGTSAFRDNGTSRESSATHVSRANSRHVFVLNSAAVEKMSYVIELKARVEQRCHPWITVWWASPYFFFHDFMSRCALNISIKI